MNSKYFDDIIANAEELEQKKALKGKRNRTIDYLNRHKFELP